MTDVESTLARRTRNASAATASVATTSSRTLDASHAARTSKTAPRDLLVQGRPRVEVRLPEEVHDERHAARPGGQRDLPQVHAQRAVRVGLAARGLLAQVQPLLARLDGQGRHREARHVQPHVQRPRARHGGALTRDVHPQFRRPAQHRVHVAVGEEPAEPQRRLFRRLHVVEQHQRARAPRHHRAPPHPAAQRHLRALREQVPQRDALDEAEPVPVEGARRDLQGVQRPRETPDPELLRRGDPHHVPLHGRVEARREARVRPRRDARERREGEAAQTVREQHLPREVADVLGTEGKRAHALQCTANEGK